MRLRKVPGVKSYRAAPDGVREMLLSSGMSKVAESEADRIAAVANDAGDATYAGRPQPVRGGYDSESRAGASVYVVEPHWWDSRDEVLKRVADAMVRRSPRD